MAHQPAFARNYSNPASRLAYERPWLVVLGVLAIFAFYVASGEYSFIRPLTAGQATSLTSSSVPAVAPISESLVAETGTGGFSGESTAPIDTGVVSSEPDFAALELSDAAVVSSQAATTTEPAEQQIVAPIQAASVAPEVAPAAAPTLSTAAAASRWASAGVVLVSERQAWDERSLRNVDAALSMLPPSVLSSLGNPALGSLHILVNTEGRSLNRSQPYGGAANYFSTNDGVNELVLFPGQRVSTVLHELGHAYNLRQTPAGHYAKVLVTPEMESFLAATDWRMLTPRETVAGAVDHTQVRFEYEGSFRWPELSHFDPLEDYANAFAMYFADPDGLRSISPERYGWMATNLPK